MTRITLTIACAEGLIPDANELACLGGHGPADRGTFGVCGWQDGEGNLYACASLGVSEAWLETMQGPLWQSAWEVDLDAAGRAQEAIVINPEAALADRLNVFTGGNPRERLVSAGLDFLEAQEA